MSIHVNITYLFMLTFLNNLLNMNLFSGISTHDTDNPYKADNLQPIKDLDHDSRITCLDWGVENEILMGCSSGIIKVYDSENNDFTSSLIPVDEVPIVGLARYEGYFII